MDQLNGHFVAASCPFSGESVELKVDNVNGTPKPVRPNLKLKVPQPIRLKNHLIPDENFDTLHSRTEENTSFVSLILLHLVSKL